MQPLRGDTTKLYDIILEYEAKEVFDKDNFSETDKKTLDYLRDLNSLYEILVPKNPDDKKIACIFDCLPGNMPTKYGFMYRNKAYFLLENALIGLFIKEGITQVWTDLSQGFAIAASNAVIRMQKSGFDISLCVAIPYKGHANQIYGASKTLYDYILSKAETVVQVSELPKDRDSFKNGLLYIINKSNVAVCCNTMAKNNEYFLKYCNSKSVPVLDFSLETLQIKE